MAKNEHLLSLVKKLIIGLAIGVFGLIFGYIFGALFADVGIVESINWEPIFTLFGGVAGFLFGVFGIEFE